MRPSVKDFQLGGIAQMSKIINYLGHYKVQCAGLTLECIFKDWLPLKALCWKTISS